jgi:hypothetical protein
MFKTTSAAAGAVPRKEHLASKSKTSSEKLSSRKKQATSEQNEKGKDQPRLPREMQNRIATLAAKKMSEECEEKITKVLGSGWESSPTVTMELTKAGLKDILARMATEDEQNVNHQILPTVV